MKIQRHGKDEGIRRLPKCFASAARAGSVGIWQWDLVTGEVVWDPQMRELFGTSDVKNVDQLAIWHRSVHPADLERVVDELERAIAILQTLNCYVSGGREDRSLFRHRRPEQARDRGTVDRIYTYDITATRKKAGRSRRFV